MAQYADITELQSMGLPTAALATVGPADQANFLLKAGDAIDSYLRAHHTLPLVGALGPPSTFPGEIVRCNLIIAAYDILTFRGYNPDEFDSQFRLRYEDCLAWLRMLATAQVSLDTADDATPGTNEGAPEVFSAGSPTVNAAVEANTLRGW